MTLTVGSLFSGIGGFDLGLERAGMKVIRQSEIDPYASAVLKKHWPDIPNHGDIRTIRAGNVERPDVLCGGFPCQDISNAGKRAGIDGERSGLWSEYARVIGELRPDYVLVENVAALLGRGLERVLGDLAALGFDAEWHCIPASAVGAPHGRDRIWIAAHTIGDGLQGRGRRGIAHCEDGSLKGRAAGGALAAPGRLADSISGQLAQRRTTGRVGWRERLSRHGDWPIASEPFVRRGTHGIACRMDRLRCLGNAIVPQVAEVIGNAIVSAA